MSSLLQLLAADLQSLRNGGSIPVVRRQLIGQLIGLVGLAVGSIALTGRLLLSQNMVSALRADPATLAPVVLSAIALGPPLLTTGLVVPDLRRTLFTSPLAELFLVAPVSRSRIVVRACTRATVMLVVLQLAIGLPALIGFWWRTGAGSGGPLVFPLLALALALPLAAGSVLGAVLARRFLSGPRVRMAVNVVGTIAALLLILAVGWGLVSGKSAQREVVAGVRAMTEIPAILLAPGTALAAAAGLVPLGVEVAWLLALPLAAVPLLCLATRLYRAAYEHGLATAAPRPPSTGRSPRGSRWPQQPWLSIARKDLVGALRLRSSLPGFALLGAFALFVVGSELFGARRVRPDDPTPWLTQGLGLLTGWHLLMLMIGTLQGAGLFADETRQYDLLASSPLPRSAMAFGKLPVLVLPYAWIAAVMLVGAPIVAAADARVLGVFAALLVPTTAIVLAVVLGVGSRLPPASVVDAGSSVGRSLVAATAVGLPTIGLMVAGQWVRGSVRHWHHDPNFEAGSLLAWAIAGHWLVAIAAVVVALRIVRRNVARWLGPAP
ncbi:MAG: hypothetical protein KDC87_09170 [Planctomycetes bacterium]|nr:hypothetical protein [Planctomycetota bacterium]MCB9868924.1 hypothetical protein [Planctomycetota bacterium]